MNISKRRWIYLKEDKSKQAAMNNSKFVRQHIIAYSRGEDGRWDAVLTKCKALCTSLQDRVLLYQCTEILLAAGHCYSSSVHCSGHEFDVNAVQLAVCCWPNAPAMAVRWMRNPLKLSLFSVKWSSCVIQFTISKTMYYAVQCSLVSVECALCTA